MCKSRREREGPRLSSESAPVFVTVKECSSGGLILKDAAKRLAAFRSCLARNTKLFSTNLLIADSSL